MGAKTDVPKFGCTSGPVTSVSVLYHGTHVTVPTKTGCVGIGDIISSHALVRYLLRHVTVTVLFLYIDVIGGTSKQEFVYTQNDFRMDSRFLPLLLCLHMYVSIRLHMEPKILEDPVLLGMVTRVPWYGTLTDVTGPLAHPNFGTSIFAYTDAPSIGL